MFSKVHSLNESDVMESHMPLANCSEDRQKWLALDGAEALPWKARGLRVIRQMDISRFHQHVFWKWKSNYGQRSWGGSWYMTLLTVSQWELHDLIQSLIFSSPWTADVCFPSCLPNVLFLAVLFKRMLMLWIRECLVTYFHVEVHFKNLHSWISIF